MAVMAYNDQLRHMLADVECVLAFNTAADFQGLPMADFDQQHRYLQSKSEKYKAWVLEYYEEQVMCWIFM